MTQRYMTCSFCGGAIDIPGNYLKATIACPSCRGVNNRSEAAPPLPESPRLAPFPQARPVPNSYPAPFTGFTRVEQKSRWWLIPLVAGLAACLAIAGLLAIPLLTGDADPAPTEGWYEYTSAAGGYSVRFPQKPTEKTQPVETELGPRVARRAIGTSDSLIYEVMFFDLGSKPEEEYVFDAEKGLSGIAELAHGKVVSHKRIKLFGLGADRGVVENDTGYRSEAVMLRIRNRVWVIICARVSAGVELSFEPFLHTFKLDEKWLPAPKPQVRSEPVPKEDEDESDSGLPLKISTDKDSLTVLAGDNAEFNLTAMGGKLPYAWGLQGLSSVFKATESGANLTLRGKPTDACDSRFEICVRDSKGGFASIQLKLSVVEIKNAENINFGARKARQSSPFSGDIYVGLPRDLSSLKWKKDATQLPAGVEFAEHADRPAVLTIHGTPAVAGEFTLEVACDVVFKEFPGHTFTFKGSFTLLVIPPVSEAPDLRALLGGTTLFLLDEGPYEEQAKRMLHRVFTDLLWHFPEEKQINIWRMNGSKWTPIFDENQPLKGADASKLRGDVLSWGFGSNYAVSLCKALAQVNAENVKGYDRVVLISPLREVDSVRDFTKLESELERISKLSGIALTIIIVKEVLPSGFGGWLGEKQIKLIHQVP